MKPSVIILSVFFVFQSCQSPGFYEYSCCTDFDLYRLPLIEPYELICSQDDDYAGWAPWNKELIIFDMPYRVDSVCLMDSLILIVTTGVYDPKNDVAENLGQINKWQIFDVNSKGNTLYNTRAEFLKNLNCSVEFISVREAFVLFKANPSLETIKSNIYMPGCK